MRTLSVLAAACLLPAVCYSQDADTVPTLDGVVTAIHAESVEVNGTPLRFTATSLSGVESKGSRSLFHGPHAFNLYVGERARVFGHLDRHTGVLTVESFFLTTPVTTQISGVGIIDLLPPATSQTPGITTVRADGRLLTITAKSVLTFAPPLTPASPLHTNQWLRYHAEQQPDGTTVVTAAEVRENTVSNQEDKLREKKEYDPVAVDPDSHQGLMSRWFRGIDLKQIPPWPDESMQARVNRIGPLLVPRYQRDLPAGDPTKIDFRFVVVDRAHVHDAITLPNGIIVVPYQVMERLENDAQVATILADNIATALEKQELRALPAAHKLTALGYAGQAGAIFVPGLGITAGVATYSAAKHLLTLSEQQSGRVSLTYLHDAGFDLTEAPRTWWLLAGKPGKPLAQVALPPRAEYLFLELGTEWRPFVSPGFLSGAPLVAIP